MKKTVFITASILCLLSTTVTAGDKSSHKAKWADSKQKSSEGGLSGAALTYMKQSERYKKRAAKSNDPELKRMYATLSENYKTLSGHKQAAAKASQAGKPYDWKAYHQLNAQTNELKKQARRYNKKMKKGAVNPDGKTYDKTKKDKTMKTGWEKESSTKEAAATPPSKTYKTSSGFTIRTKL